MAGAALHAWPQRRQLRCPCAELGLPVVGKRTAMAGPQQARRRWASRCSRGGMPLRQYTSSSCWSRRMARQGLMADADAPRCLILGDASS